MNWSFYSSISINGTPEPSILRAYVFLLIIGACLASDFFCKKHPRWSSCVRRFKEKQHHIQSTAVKLNKRCFSCPKDGGCTPDSAAMSVLPPQSCIGHLGHSTHSWQSRCCKSSPNDRPFGIWKEWEVQNYGAVIRHRFVGQLPQDD